MDILLSRAAHAVGGMLSDPPEVLGVGRWVNDRVPRCLQVVRGRDGRCLRPQPGRALGPGHRTGRFEWLRQDHPAAHGEPARDAHLRQGADRRHRRGRTQPGRAATQHRLRHAELRTPAPPLDRRQHRHGARSFHRLRFITFLL